MGTSHESEMALLGVSSCSGSLRPINAPNRIVAFEILLWARGDTAKIMWSPSSCRREEDSGRWQTFLPRLQLPPDEDRAGPAEQPRFPAHVRSPPEAYESKQTPVDIRAESLESLPRTEPREIAQEKNQRRKGNRETCNRARNPDIKQNVPRTQWRTNADERSHGSN